MIQAMAIAVCLAQQSLISPYKNWDELDDWQKFKAAVSDREFVRVIAKQFEFKGENEPEFEIPRPVFRGGTRVTLLISKYGKVRIEEAGKAAIGLTGVEGKSTPDTRGVDFWSMLKPAFSKEKPFSLNRVTVIRQTKQILVGGSCEAWLQEGSRFEGLSFTAYSVDFGSRSVYWFDAKTRLPVEVTFQSLGPMAPSFGIRWVDLEWDLNAKANDKDFEVKPPIH